MKKFIAILAVVALAAGSFVPAQAAESFRRQTVSKTVVSGIRTKLAQNTHIDRDCSLVDVPFTRIVEKPKHGRLEIARERVFPNSKGEYARCRTVKVMGLVAYFTAEAGYEGKDRFTLRAPYGDGMVEDVTFSVTVLK